MDPDAYRSLTWADLPRLLIKLFGTSLLMWVYFATSIKRLHDRDKSGWWMVPFFAVPGLYNQFADRLPDSHCGPAARLAASALCLWGFIEMYCLKGSRKTNRSAPTRWRRRRRAIRGRPGTSRARSKWCRTRLARRRFGVLSGRHE